MLAHAHAGLGWVIGVASPTTDRRLRIWCTAAAILPDLDALTMLAGDSVSSRLHHAFGHNIFTGELCVLAAAWAFRKYPARAWISAMVFVALSFASHLLADMKLSGRELPLFCPLSARGVQFHPNLPSGHWINIVLAVGLMIVPWALAPWKGLTPLDLLSPRLDRLFLNLFRPRRRACSSCGRPCNNRCDGCTRPVCLRHGRLGWRFRVRCPSCAARGPEKRAPGGIEDVLVRQLGFLRDPAASRLDAEFAAFLERKLSEGLRRLDAVPRTNALWEGSDQEPTLAKVADLCRLLLRETPEDDEARWVLFADSVRSCSPDLGFQAIEPLILRDLGALHWLVAAARWNYHLSGVDPVVALRGPFQSLGRTLGPLEGVLRELAKEPDPRTNAAAARCLELLGGENPFRTAPRPATPGDFL